MAHVCALIRCSHLCQDRVSKYSHGVQGRGQDSTRALGTQLSPGPSRRSDDPGSSECVCCPSTLSGLRRPAPKPPTPVCHAVRPQLAWGALGQHASSMGTAPHCSVAAAASPALDNGQIFSGAQGSQGHGGNKPPRCGLTGWTLTWDLCAPPMPASVGVPQDFTSVPQEQHREAPHGDEPHWDPPSRRPAQSQSHAWTCSSAACPVPCAHCPWCQQPLTGQALAGWARPSLRASSWDLLFLGAGLRLGMGRCADSRRLPPRLLASPRDMSCFGDALGSRACQEKPSSLQTPCRRR